MKDFKTYRTENEKTTKREEDVTVATELTKKALSAYDGKSSASVMLDILKQAESAKRAGQLSDEEIDAFYDQVSPLLDESQRKLLKSVTERLKKI